MWVQIPQVLYKLVFKIMLFFLHRFLLQIIRKIRKEIATLTYEHSLYSNIRLTKAIRELAQWQSDRFTHGRLGVQISYSLLGTIQYYNAYSKLIIISIILLLVMVGNAVITIKQKDQTISHYLELQCPFYTNTIFKILL